MQNALASGAGVLITPNHSFHYDSYVLFEAAEQVGRPFYTMTAWQVFAMSSRLDQWILQKHGCFSIDREKSDTQAFRWSVDILRASPFPLLIFPEGDIYHTNDRVTPFREGAAAIAIAAARKAERPIVAIPCAVKCWYVQDPTPGLLTLMDELERQLHWRPRPNLPLDERIYRFAEGIITLKELEYLGQPQRGTIRRRITALAGLILQRLEEKHQFVPRSSSIPERVKELRRHLIGRLEAEPGSELLQRQYRDEMDDLFFVVQLFSYPGDYAAEKPSIERLAETLDKFEEDILEAKYPTIRGKRRAVVRFGAPIPIPRHRERGETTVLTAKLEAEVQRLLDELNAPPCPPAETPPLIAATIGEPA